MRDGEKDRALTCSEAHLIQGEVERDPQSQEKKRKGQS